MGELLVVPAGEVEDMWLNAARSCVEELMRMPAVVTAPISIPAECYDPRRNQFLATRMLEQLLPLGRDRNTRVLGVTELDIFIPILTFMFGQAQLGGRLALVSMARIRPEFYGFPADPALTLLRLRKTIRHELGHTLGLVHCSDPQCAMSLANSIVQLDVKNDSFCALCLEKSRAHLRTVHSGGKA